MALALGNNSLEHVVAHVGAAMAGVTLVTAKDPSEPHLAGCRGLIVSADVLGDRAPQGILPGEKHPPIVAHDDWGVGSASVALFYDAFVDTRPLDLSAIAANTDALAQFTPGKATSHAELLALGEQASSYLKMKAADRLCLPIPVAHPFGFGSGVLAVLLAGGTLVLPASKSIEDVLTAVETEECTLVYADSHIVKALAAAQNPATQSLRGGICKIGSGTAIGLGENVDFNGVPLATIGKP